MHGSLRRCHDTRGAQMDTIQDILSENPVRIAFAAVATVVFFAHIVLLMRIAGKRTLAEMTTFDFVTNVTIGSILPAAIVTRGIAFWTGLAVLTMVVALQYAVTWFAARSPKFQDLVTNPPRLLYYDGSFIEENMRRERVSEQQLRGKLREQGYARLSGIDAIVMETSGALSVLKSGQEIELLSDVRDGTGARHEPTPSRSSR